MYIIMRGVLHITVFRGGNHTGGLHSNVFRGDLHIIVIKGDPYTLHS